MPTLQTFEGVYLWKYIPSLALSIVFAIIFFVATAVHTWKMVQMRVWFCSPFVIGGIFEVIGYAFRAASYNNTGSLVTYLMQAIFLLLPAIMFAATLYMVYSRVVRAVHGELLSLLSPRWTTRLFVLCDFLFLNVQSSGAGLLGHDNTTAIGNDIVIAGLVLQIAGFVIFVITCAIFHRRARACLLAERSSQMLSSSPHANHTNTSSPLDLVAAKHVPWQRIFAMLYLTSAAILVRNVYRVVEYIQGTDGYLQSCEWPVYVFDAAPMLIVMAAFFVAHPGVLQPTAEQPFMLEPITSNAAGQGKVR